MQYKLSKLDYTILIMYQMKKLKNRIFGETSKFSQLMHVGTDIWKLSCVPGEDLSLINRKYTMDLNIYTT